MKIVLVQPNPRNCKAYPVFASPPLGLLYIAAALRQAGHGTPVILDCRLERLSRPEVLARLQALEPDLVGISGMSLEVEEVHSVAMFAKAANPDCKVVVGGPCALTTPEELLGDRNIDLAVIGEGERAASDLVGALRSGADWSALPGLAYKRGGEVVINPRGEPEDVETLPLPAWDLVDTERYFAQWTRHSENPFPASERTLPVFASRGCPYGCVYCHNIFGKKARLRSPESVLAEVKLLVEKYRVGEIEFVEDIFNIDLPRAKRICDGLAALKLPVKFSFPNGLRADRMDRELVDKMKAAGVHLVFYAVESASPEIQKLIGKNLDLAKAREMVLYTAGRGIKTGGFFMLGFPGETREQMRLTIDFAKSLPLFLASFFYVTPRPNTRLFEMALEARPWLKDARLGNYFRYSVNLSAVPDVEFKGLAERAHDEFMRRPAQWWRVLTGIPDWKYFLKIFLRFFFLRNRA